MKPSARSRRGINAVGPASYTPPPRERRRAPAPPLGITAQSVLLCPVLLLRNEPEAALEVIDHGLPIVSHNSERIFEAELYRLKARALLMRGAPDAEAETLLDQALRTARTNRRDRSNFARQPPETIEAARASSDGGDAEPLGGSSAGKQPDAVHRRRPGGPPCSVPGARD